MNPEMIKQFETQMEVMFQRARKWRADNPDKQALVQFNVPSKIFFISPISAAIREKVVTTNGPGLELVKALWPWDDEYEPTVNMVRLALEGKAMSDELKHILATIPVDKRAQQRVGIRKYLPPPGSVQVDCTRCGQKVWLGPKGLEWSKKFPKTPVLCPLCMVQSGALTEQDQSNITSLGGQSGKFVLNDGTKL